MYDVDCWNFLWKADLCKYESTFLAKEDSQKSKEIYNGWEKRKKSKWLTESCIWKWSSCFVSVLSSVFPPPHPPSPPRANLSGACCLSLTLQTDYCLPWRKDCYLTRKCLSIVADHLCGCYQSHSCTEAGCSEGWGEKAAAASVQAASTGTACWLKAKLLLFLYSNLKRGKKVLYCNERQCWCRNLCRCRRGGAAASDVTAAAWMAPLGHQHHCHPRPSLYNGMQFHPKIYDLRKNGVELEEDFWFHGARF